MGDLWYLKLCKSELYQINVYMYFILFNMKGNINWVYGFGYIVELEQSDQVILQIRYLV